MHDLVEIGNLIPVINLDVQMFCGHKEPDPTFWPPTVPAAQRSDFNSYVPSLRHLGLSCSTARDIRNEGEILADSECSAWIA